MKDRLIRSKTMPRRVRRRSGEKIGFIFDGGVYVGKNTAQAAKCASKASARSRLHSICLKRRHGVLGRENAMGVAVLTHLQEGA